MVIFRTNNKMETENLQAALSEVQTDFPFNNIRRILKWEDHSLRLPKAFGGACVFQLKQLRERVKSLEEHEIHFLEELGGTHSVMICKHKETGELILMDPFLLHKEPINLSKVLSKRKPESFPIHPTLAGIAQMRLEIRPSSRSTFQITLYYNPWNESDYTVYTFDASKLLPRHPSITEARIKSEVPEFVLRLFRPEEGTTTLAANRDTGSIVIRKKGLHNRRFYEVTTGFREELGRISERVHLDISELLGLFAQSRKIYNGFRE